MRTVLSIALILSSVMAIVIFLFMWLDRGFFKALATFENVIDDFLSEKGGK